VRAIGNPVEALRLPDTSIFACGVAVVLGLGPAYASSRSVSCSPVTGKTRASSGSRSM
jgi:MFS-type transporter involved in bile tolerance (Atg22 family)